ncbi:hypothetical protein F4818DRAFT_396546 [Hypoxylon cercidicola]|nr:hypothetical protein F4818DRAFT_396546 [Hypoxylon cercidicola]
MRFSVLLEILSFAASAFAQSSPPELPVVSSISSQIPPQCSPGKSIGISIDATMITTSLSEVQFQSLGHGRTGGFANCDFKVELNSWYYNYRVAISGATIRGNANLSDGVKIYQFNTTAVFRLEHLKNFSPVTPPEVTNLAKSTMLGQLTTTNDIGGSGIYDDDFNVPISSPSEKVWSPCFQGSEGSGQDSTYLEFYVSASSSDETGEGDAKLSSGLTVDWDLVWEECTPNSNSTYVSWGNERVDDWQSCTYR